LSEEVTMPPTDNAAPTGPTVEGLDILLRNRVAHRKAKQAERDEAIRRAALLMREIDELDRGIADLVDQRLAVMMGAGVDTMANLAQRLAPFVGHP
jgi:hypothetical protein